MTLARPSILVSAALLLGIGAGAAWPPPPLPKIAQTEAAWSLPAANRLVRHAPQDVATVIKDMHWQQDGSAGAGGSGSGWRLLGVLNGKSAAILIAASNSPDKVTRINLGERLPDGSTLESARGDKATTSLDSCKSTYQLFIEQAIEKSGACEDAAASDQGSSQ